MYQRYSVVENVNLIKITNNKTTTISNAFNVVKNKII